MKKIKNLFLFPSYFNTNNGTTIYELVIFLTVAGILMAAAVPNFKSYSNMQSLSGFSRKIITDMRAARQDAIAQGNYFLCIFSYENHGYYIVDDDDSDGIKDPGEKTSKLFRLHDGISLINVNFTGNKAIFYPSGTASEGSVTIGLIGCDTIQVNVLSSGVVEVEEN